MMCTTDKIQADKLEAKTSIESHFDFLSRLFTNL